MKEVIKIKKLLKSKIKDCKKQGQNDNDLSWNYQEGILISSGDAKVILKALNNYTDLIKNVPQSY